MAQGYLSRLGFALEPVVYADTWPAVTAATVSAQLGPSQLAMNGQALLRYQTEREALIAILLATRARQESAASALYPVRYEGLEATWAAALGYQARSIGGTTFPAEIVSGAYRHRFELAPRLRGEPWTLADGFTLGSGMIQGQQRIRRGTLAALISTVSVHELLSAMVTSWGLSASSNTAWGLAVDYQGYSVSYTSSVNTVAGMQALGGITAPRALWQQTVIRLAPYSDSTALDSGDIVNPSAIALQVDNRLRVAQSRRTGLAIEQPTRGDLPTVTGTLTFPRYTADTLLAAQRAGTPYMMDVTITGGQIAATGENYQLALYLPTITLDTVTVGTVGPELTSLAVAFTARAPRVAAAGFPATALNPALILEVVSGSSTHPLLP